MSLAFIRAMRPTSPGIRWKRKLRLHKNTAKVLKQFRVPFNWHAGRNVNGRVAFNTFSKRKLRKRITVTAAKLNFYDIAVARLYSFTFEKNKPRVSFVTKNGGSFVLPATLTNQPGKVYYSINSTLPTYSRHFLGLPTLLLNVPYYTRVSNITTQPCHKFQYATPPGSVCTKLRAPKREKNQKLRLPSQQFKYFTKDSLAIIGINQQF